LQPPFPPHPPHPPQKGIGGIGGIGSSQQPQSLLQLPQPQLQPPLMPLLQLPQPPLPPQLPPLREASTIVVAKEATKQTTNKIVIVFLILENVCFLTDFLS
jgi:hypothetical protein